MVSKRYTYIKVSILLYKEIEAVEEETNWTKLGVVLVIYVYKENYFKKNN